MPYMIRKVAGKHHVYKRGKNGQPTGAALGKHSTRVSAVDQLRALYSNEPFAPPAQQGTKGMFDNIGSNWSPVNPPQGPWSDQNDGDGDDYVGDIQTPKLSPDDPRVDYDPVGADKTNACANCFFFDADDSACRLIKGDIVATGLCNMWLRELSDAEKDDQTAMPVRNVASKQGDFLEKVKATIGPWLNQSGENLYTDDTPEPIDEPITGFKTFGPDNQYWAAFFSNNAPDRDKETFAQSAHDKAIARLDSGRVPMPKLDYWHSKAYHGEAFYVDRIGHIMMAVGEFYPDEFSQAMKQYYETAPPEDNLVSFGYYYPRSQLIDGVYYDYTPFEISPLPATVAANLWTGFASIQEFKSMNTSAQKRKELERRLGPELANRLLATAGEKSRALDQIETAFKDQSDPVMEQIAALQEAVLVLAGRKDTKTSPTKPTGKMGQPSTEDEMVDTEDDDGGVDADEEQDEYYGRLKKQISSLKRQLKAAKADPDDDGDEEDGEQGQDEEDESEEPNRKAKARRTKARSPERGLNELAQGFKAINDNMNLVAQSIAKMNQQQAALGNQINQLAKEIYSPTPASRSPYSVVPPEDPALQTLAAKMAGGGDQNGLPNQAPEAINAKAYMELLGLPTVMQPNGRY